MCLAEDLLIDAGWIAGRGKHFDEVMGDLDDLVNRVGLLYGFEKNLK